MTNDKEKSFILAGARRGSFAEAFPKIQTAKMEITVIENIGRIPKNAKTVTYNEKDMPPFYKCENKNCKGGGLDVQGIIRGMVAAKETVFEDRKLCQGNEVYHKGRTTSDPCRYNFNVKLNLKYR